MFTHQRPEPQTPSTDPVDHPAIRYVCPSCGVDAGCNCAVAPITRAEYALLKNPDKSDRAIAAEIGVAPNTVKKARKSTAHGCAVEKRTGLDGKVRKVPMKAATTAAIPAETVVTTVTTTALTDANAVKPPTALVCSWCGRSQYQVRKLVAGPSVCICNACVEQCHQVCMEDAPPPPTDEERFYGALIWAVHLAHLATPAAGEIRCRSLPAPPEAAAGLLERERKGAAEIGDGDDDTETLELFLKMADAGVAWLADFARAWMERRQP